MERAARGAVRVVFFRPVANLCGCPLSGPDRRPIAAYGKKAYGKKAYGKKQTRPDQDSPSGPRGPTRGGWGRTRRSQTSTAAGRQLLYEKVTSNWRLHD